MESSSFCPQFVFCRRSGPAFIKTYSSHNYNNLEALGLPEFGWKPAEEAKKQAEERRARVADKNRIPLRGLALYRISRDNLVRQRLYSVVTSKRFEWLMLCIVLLNCVSLGFETPISNPDSITVKVVHIRWEVKTCGGV